MRRRTSTRVVGRRLPGRATTWPRRTWSGCTPVRLIASRLPGTPTSSAFLCVCSPRMRVRNSPGTISTSSPTLNWPLLRVPVTTVPKPEILKTRSIGRRGWPLSGRGGTAASATAKACRKVSSPWPVRAETGMIGDFGQARAGQGLAQIGLVPVPASLLRSPRLL